MAEEERTGLVPVDLEKELTCSVRVRRLRDVGVGVGRRQSDAEMATQPVAEEGGIGFARRLRGVSPVSERTTRSTRAGFASTHLLTVPRPDMYRPALPAPHSARLPAYLLRRMSKGMVPIPGSLCDVASSVHMPVMSRLGAYDAAQCDRHHPARHVHKRKPWARQV